MGVGEQGGPASSALRPVEDELSEDESSPEALAPRPASAPAASAAPAPTPMLQVTPSGPRPSATPGTGFFHSAGGASAAQLPGPPSAPSPSKRELQRQIMAIQAEIASLARAARASVTGPSALQRPAAEAASAPAAAVAAPAPGHLRQPVRAVAFDVPEVDRPPGGPAQPGPDGPAAAPPVARSGPATICSAEDASAALGALEMLQQMMAGPPPRAAPPVPWKAAWSKYFAEWPPFQHLASTQRFPVEHGLDGVAVPTPSTLAHVEALVACVKAAKDAAASAQLSAAQARPHPTRDTTAGSGFSDAGAGDWYRGELLADAAHARQDPTVTMIGYLPPKRAAGFIFVGSSQLRFPFSLTAPTSLDCVVAAQLAQVNDSRFFGDPTAVAQWLGTCVKLTELPDDAKATVKEGLRTGRLPSLSMFVPVPAGSLSRHTLDRVHLSGLQIATALHTLAQVLQHVYGPHNVLSPHVQALIDNGSVSAYADAARRSAGLAGLTAAQGEKAADTAFVRAFDVGYGAWFERVRLHFVAALQAAEPSPSGSYPPLGAFPCTLAEYVPLVPPHAYLAFELAAATFAHAPPPARPLVRPSPAPALRAPALPRQSPSAATPPIDVSSTTVPAVLSEARLHRYASAGKAIAVHPDLSRLRFEGREVCVKHALFGSTGCDGTSCNRAHLPAAMVPAVVTAPSAH